MLKIGINCFEVIVIQMESILYVFGSNITLLGSFLSFVMF